MTALPTLGLYAFVSLAGHVSTDRTIETVGQRSSDSEPTQQP